MKTHTEVMRYAIVVIVVYDSATYPGYPGRKGRGGEWGIEDLDQEEADWSKGSSLSSIYIHMQDARRRGGPKALYVGRGQPWEGGTSKKPRKKESSRIHVDVKLDLIIITIIIILCLIS
jgi:hypothetical protein